MVTAYCFCNQRTEDAERQRIIERFLPAIFADTLGKISLPIHESNSDEGKPRSEDSLDGRPKARRVRPNRWEAFRASRTPSKNMRQVYCQIRDALVASMFVCEVESNFSKARHTTQIILILRAGSNARNLLINGSGYVRGVPTNYNRVSKRRAASGCHVHHRL